MPRKKITKSGRPKGTYSEMDQDELKEYHRQAVQNHRVATAPATTPESPKTPRRERNASDQTQKAVGRPPLDDTPMTPNTLKRRKREASAVRYKKKKISALRKKAVKVRWTFPKKNNGIEEGEGSNTYGNEDSSSPGVETESEGEEIESGVTADCGNEEVADADNSGAVIDEEMPSTTFYRYRARLVGMFQRNPIDNLKVFMLCLSHFNHLELTVPIIESLMHMGTLTIRQQRYQKAKLYERVLKYFSSEISQKKLFLYWIEKLMGDRLIENLFITHWNLPTDLTPRSIVLAELAADIGKRFIQRHNTTEAQRIQGISYVVAVAREAKLSVDNDGDISALAKAATCTRRFANSVLKAIANDDVNSLLKRNLKCNSIKATHWPNEIVQFVLKPENSRAVPGKASVSVRYGVRRPKFILLHPKVEIAKSFKTAFPECEFSISTIVREFPQNAVTASSREKERNTCPYHANARRLLRCLHSNKIAKDIPVSCRQMCGIAMCKHEDVIIDDPLTWHQDCVYGRCKECAHPVIHVPTEISTLTAAYSAWMKGEKVQEETKKRNKESNEAEQSKKKKNGIKVKKVYSLFPVTDTLQNIADTFLHSLPKLKQHIYTAHRQWQAHSEARKKLTVDSIITIEDYQRNIEVEYIEKPTSMAYSSNTLTVAVYPICVEYHDEEGSLKKGAITFISDDKSHDHQQVQQFEKRMFSILRNDYNMEIKHWHRWSDGCGAQFKSQYCTADLLNSKELFDLEHVTFSYFEAHEGKNISDTIGSIVKCSFLKAIAKENEGILNAKDVVRLLKDSVKAQTEKFTFFLVEEFPFFDRLPEGERESFLINGINSFHHLTEKEKGIITGEISCIDCSPSALCELCDGKDAYFAQDDIFPDQDTEEGHTIDQDEQDEGKSESDESDVSADENLTLAPGDIVWAKYGRFYYPAKITSYDELPTNLKTGLFRKRKTDSVIVKWYGETNFSWVHIRNIDELAENKIDSSRASLTENMQQKYQLALAELRNE